MDKMELSTFFVDALRKELCSQEMPNSDFISREISVAKALLIQSKNFQNIVEGIERQETEKVSRKRKRANEKEEVEQDQGPDSSKRFVALCEGETTRSDEIAFLSSVEENCRENEKVGDRLDDPHFNRLPKVNSL